MKHVVYSGLAVMVATFDSPEDAETFRASADEWYGEYHPLTPLRVSTTESGSVVYGGSRGVIHDICDGSDEAQARAEELNDLRSPFSHDRAKVQDIRHHNMRPFPVEAMRRMEAAEKE